VTAHRWIVGTLTAVVALATVVALTMVGPSVARADSVTLKGGITVRGTILRDDRHGVVVQMSDGSKKTFPRQRVLRVHKTRLPLLDTADSWFANNRLSDAMACYRRVLRETDMPWARHRAAVRLVECLRLTDKLDEAVKTYLDHLTDEASRTDGPSLPLVWALHEATYKQVLNASAWAAPQPDPYATHLGRLIACSVYVSATDHSRAEAMLKELRGSRYPRLAALAEVLQWRATLNAAGLARRVEAWQARVAKLPATARAAGHFVVGEASEKLGRPGPAALAYLQVWVRSCDDPFLMAAAGGGAARCLQAAGMHVDAKRMLETLLQRYPYSPQGKRAQQLLDEAAPSSAPKGAAAQTPQPDLSEGDQP